MCMRVYVYDPYICVPLLSHPQAQKTMVQERKSKVECVKERVNYYSYHITDYPKCASVCVGDFAKYIYAYSLCIYYQCLEI